MRRAATAGWGCCGQWRESCSIVTPRGGQPCRHAPGAGRESVRVLTDGSLVQSSDACTDLAADVQRADGVNEHAGQRRRATAASLVPGCRRVFRCAGGHDSPCSTRHSTSSLADRLRVHVSRERPGDPSGRERYPAGRCRVLSGETRRRGMLGVQVASCCTAQVRMRQHEEVSEPRRSDYGRV